MIACITVILFTRPSYGSEWPWVRNLKVTPDFALPGQLRKVAGVLVSTRNLDQVLRLVHKNGLFCNTKLVYRERRAPRLDLLEQRSGDQFFRQQVKMYAREQILRNHPASQDWTMKQLM